MQSNIVISKSMATPPVRRNSAYGPSSSAKTSSTPSNNKSSQNMRRSQSMRYPQRHHNNINNNNNNHLTVNGISSNTAAQSQSQSQSSFNKGNRVASVPSNIVELNGDKNINEEFNYNNSNGTAHKTVNKINGKSDYLFNFIIAKDVDHFKNQKVFRVLVVGSPDSGKTSLISQFSYFLEEHRKQFPCSKQPKYDQTQEQYLILNFCEIISLDNCFPRSPIAMYQPDAYIVLYAVNDRESFESAKQLIHEIHKWDDIDMKPVILVANKTDLVRSRTVTKQEGRQLAMANNCKYIETSCAISHNIDFLLAGIGAQINLKSNTKQSHISSTRKPNLFKRLLRKAALNKSKSCDNLHVL